MRRDKTSYEDLPPSTQLDLFEELYLPGGQHRGFKMIINWVIFGLFWHFFLNLSTEPKEYTEYTYMILYHFLTSENSNKKYLSKFYIVKFAPARQNFPIRAMAWIRAQFPCLILVLDSLCYHYKYCSITLKIFAFLNKILWD